MSDGESRQHHWRRGMPSPNPGGRPRLEGRIRKLAQRHSRKAIMRLVRLMDSENPRIAVVAANSILDRALGRPAQSVALSGPDGEPLRLGAPVTSAIEAARIYAQVLGGAIAIESVRIVPSASEPASHQSPESSPADFVSEAAVRSVDVETSSSRDAHKVQAYAPSESSADDPEAKVVDIWSRLAK